MPSGRQIDNTVRRGDLIFGVRLHTNKSGKKADTTVSNIVYVSMRTLNTLLHDLDRRREALIKNRLVPVTERVPGVVASINDVTRSRSTPVGSSFAAKTALVIDEQGDATTSIQVMGIVAWERSPAARFVATGDLQQVTVQIDSSNAGTKINSDWVASKDSLGTTVPCGGNGLFVHIGKPNGGTEIRVTQVIADRSATRAPMPPAEGTGGIFPRSYQEATSTRTSSGAIVPGFTQRSARWIFVGTIKESGNLSTMTMEDKESLKNTGSLIGTGGALSMREKTHGSLAITCFFETP